MFSDLSTISKKILLVFITVISLMIIEVIYYNYQSKNMTEVIQQKKKAVSLTQLPDLAFVTETVWLRHRTITNMFSVFPEDGTLLDYYPASFVYNLKLPSHIKINHQEKKQ